MAASGPRGVHLFTRYLTSIFKLKLMRSKESLAAIVVYVSFARLCVARGVSLIPAKAGNWTSHVAADPCLRRDERKSLNTADTHEGGYPDLDRPTQNAVRFKHEFPSAREPADAPTDC